jgi:CRP/FNR family transcriptional regulator, cyclic AMP receptor protein
MTKPWIARLHEIDLFAQCTDKELEVIDALMTEVSLPAGRVLMREGDVGLECFVIEAGEAVVTRGGEELARRGPGTIVGELALIDHGPRTATVTAATPVTAYVLNRGEFASLLADAPDVAEKVTRELEARRGAAATGGAT